MRHAARKGSLFALASIALFAATSAPAAHAAFGVMESNFEAGTCVEASCTYASPKAVFYTQAAGHPPFGITTFEVNHKKGLLAEEPEGAPLKRVRVDIPPGLAADPETLEKCPIAEFKADNCATKYPGSRVGTNQLTVFIKALGTKLEVEAPVYDLVQPAGLPLEFGIHVEAVAGLLANEHVLLEGHVSWAKEPALEARGIASGDYHEYFEINGIEQENPALKSKLIFNGRAGKGNFLTLPSVCSSSTTSYLEVESGAGQISRTQTHTPVGVEGCDKVPFKPTVEVHPATAQSDKPDGGMTEVKVPQNAGSGEINTADIKDVHLMLPEGLTLNPSAAHGLGTEACTAAEIGIGTANEVKCPIASKVGEVAIETDLPPKSLFGNVYLGNPGGGPITGPPYTIYIDAESNLGVSVRLKGLVSPNLSTGRVEASFVENPQLPFSDLILQLKGGEQAPLANPLACGTAHVETLLTPYTGGAQFLSSTPFVTNGCPSPLPFSLSQSTQNSSLNAGAYTSYSFNLGRADGQQYLSRVATTLPAGLLGAIPSVALCGEPQAAQGACASSSQIGVATVAAGAGAEPYSFSGPVFLTGPYAGAPYGLSIVVPAVAGPFNLGNVVTRAQINVDPHTSRVIVTSSLPTIVGGVPLRLKNINVTVNRPSFMFNPTFCGALATDSTLTSTFGATQGLSSPFGVTGCGALAFKPSFKASTSAKTSRSKGASLRVTITQPVHQANIRSVLAQLPKALPSRLTTLQKACPEATFAANPISCRPLGSEVGTATVSTPVLPGTLTGSAYLVSHGGAAFPDLDLVLEGDGVRVILVGNTNIKNGITTSNFATLPDVPVSSVALDFPVGPHSALTAIGSLCTKPLVMPTTITAQSGAVIKQNTRISVSNCGVRVLGHRVSGHTLYLKVQTFAAGRISARGADVVTASRRVSKATRTTLKVRLSRRGLRALRRHHPLKLRVRVSFVPKQRGGERSTASVAVKFRR
ncbi:MAG TPA: hypothetical protein VGG98_02350 [Solirubrobacteraceae bacterium]|jgi:hypothetical protein